MRNLRSAKERRVEAPGDLEAFELIVDGDAYVLFEWSARSASHAAHVPQLTDAERAVLAGVLHGDSNAEIARQRGTRPRTIANQVASLFRKFGVRSRLELIKRMTIDDAEQRPSTNRRRKLDQSPATMVGGAST